MSEKSAEIKKAFEDERTSGYASDYIAELLVAWRECERSASRSLLLLTLVSVGAILVARHQVAQLSVGGLTVTETEWLLGAFPVVIAYLYSSLFMRLAESFLSEEAFEVVVRSVWPGLWDTGLAQSLHPPSTFITSTSIRFGLPKGTGRLLAQIAALIRFVVVVVLPLAVEIYLYYRAYDEFGASSLYLWASAAISTILLASGIVYLVAAVNAIGMYSSAADGNS